MTEGPGDAFRGALTVAARDLRSNARGLKMWLISGLTLLAVLGSAFGIGAIVSQAPPLAAQYHMWASPYWPDANGSAPGIEVWVSDYLGSPHAGFPVVLGNKYTNPFNKTFVANTTASTNATGWLLFPNLGPGEWPLLFQAGALRPPPLEIVLTSVRPPYNLSVDFERFDVLGDGAARDLALQARWANGTPVVGATVTVNGTTAPLGSTNAFGFLAHRFSDGVYTVRVAKAGSYQEYELTVRRNPLAVLPLLQGPDALLLFLGVELMNLFAPILAIAMSYDAVAKERMQGSLEILLAHPASRAGIAVGKFLGSFLSVGLPIIGILLGAFVGVAGVSGQWPDATFAAAVVVGTLGLVACYVLIMQIFSTLARSAGTAILSAIVVWFVFNVVWVLVFLTVQAAFHIETGTPEAFRLSGVTSLFNPNTVYTLFVEAFMPPSVLGLFGTTGTGDLPDWIGAVAMLVWIVLLMAIAVHVFRKRII